NGVQDNSELGRAGVTVYLDADNNGRLDPGETSTTTGSDGSYTFSNLAAGTYSVRVNAPFTATTNTAGGTATVAVTLGFTQTANFGLLGLSPGFPVPVPSAIYT